MLAPFDRALQILAFGAATALLAVLAEAGAATCPATGASLAVLAEAGAAACLAFSASLAVLAEAGATACLAAVAALAVLANAGATACLAVVALLAVLANAGATACPALVASLAVLALLPDTLLHWVRHWRRWYRRGCRGCWVCHCGPLVRTAVAAILAKLGWLPFDRCRDRPRASPNAPQAGRERASHCEERASELATAKRERAS